MSLALIILGLYGSSLWFNYGFMDDYPSVYRAGHTHRWCILEDGIANGRPITNFFASIGYSSAKTIANLRYMRLFGMFGISAAATVIWIAMRWRGVSSAVSTACAILFCCLPTTTVIVNWCALMMAPWTVVLTFLAFESVDHRIRERRRIWPGQLFAIPALACAALIYQPNAFFVVLFWMIKNWPSSADFKRLCRSASIHGVTLGAAMIGPVLYSRSVVSPVRSALVEDVGAKILWYIKQPLTNALSPFMVRSTDAPQDPRNIAATTVGVILCALIFWQKKPIGVRLFNLALATILLIACYLPFFIINESWASYRTLWCLSSMVLCMGCLLYDDILKRSGPRARTGLLRAGGIAVVLMCIISTHRSAYYFVQPQVTELNMLKTEIISAVKDGRSDFFGQVANWYDTRTGVAYDEFGISSSSAEWALESMFLLTLEEVRNLGHINAPESTKFAIGSTPPEGNQAYVLDMTRLFNFKTAE